MTVADSGQRELRFADPWSASADVLVLAGPPSEAERMQAEAAERVGADLVTLFARRDRDGLVIVDTGADSWFRVAWLPIPTGAAGLARRPGAILADAVDADAALVISDSLTDEQVTALLQGWRLGGYRFRLPGGRSRSDEAAGSLTVGRSTPDRPAAESLTSSVLLARDLGNTPSNIKSPQWLADRVVSAGKKAGLRTSVLDAEALRRAGCGGILAVGGGSARPPAMVTLRSKGSGPRVVLIGKGVTFDSGGLSLKPADSMALMKTDMAGAAAVAGAMLAYAAQPGRNGDADVWALLPMAENAVSGRSYRPGDVITHPDGRTSEVANTDAEGRLLLADALSYARGRLDPAVMIDAATLTGAATLGLSRHYAALYSDVESLAAQLERAGEASGDAVWRMPLRDSYLSALGSEIADTSQVSVDPGMRAGSIIAALYLRQFAGDVPWAHIDMAGPARADKPRGEHPVGATGFGVRLLATWLRTADLGRVVR